MTTDITTVDDILSAYAEAAAELATGAKLILKFQKGDWLLGQEAEELRPGTRLAVDMSNAERGWVRWRDGKPVERRMSLIAARGSMPARHELSHEDESLWDKDGEGRVRDPWQFMVEFPAREIDGERREVIISGGSRGWESCCKALLTDYSKGGRQNPGKTPVVELASDRYQHKIYGSVKVPTLPIVAWLTDEELTNGVSGNGQKKRPPKRF